jgi:hypothetical protein
MFWPSKKEASEKAIVLSTNQLSTSFDIPEPTKSLLWVTDEDTSKIRSSGGLSITISFTPQGVDLKQEKISNLEAEPSRIWTKLPVKRNSELEQKPLYYPSYSAFAPEQRFQYLSWLRDVDQETNLSYVFLYTYGLERHLLLDTYKIASAQMLRLLEHHNKGTFPAYVQGSLIAIALHREDKELLSDCMALFTGLTNELLLLRRLMGIRLDPKEIMSTASQVGFKNRRYLKSYPEQFERELEKVLVEFEYKNGSVLDFVPFDHLEVIERPILANLSLRDLKAKIPQLLYNPEFKDVLKDLLDQAHEKLKLIKNHSNI